ncbi:hypothetical protein SALBM311S_10274 [Streptomyces alboniger]
MLVAADVVADGIPARRLADDGHVLFELLDPDAADPLHDLEVLPDAQDWLRHLARAAAAGAGLVQCGTLRLRADALVEGITLAPGLDGAAYAARRDLLGTTGRTAAWVTVPRLLVRRLPDSTAATASAARAAGAGL